MAIPMPYEPAGATPRNMGTQCQNIDAENQNTSDPLLKVVLWIAYLTEIGAILIGYVLLIFSIFLLIVLLLFGFPSSVFLSLAGGVMGWCYLHLLWVKPARHLRLGIQQLSANKFVPWMLTAFIHSLPPAVFFGCYTATRTNNPPWPLEGIYWTYWHWLIVWTLILTPQFVVLAAFIRVHRLNNERRKNESPSLLLTWRRPSTEVGAFQNIGTPTTTPPQPDVPSRSQYVCLSVDIPETSHLSEDDLEDLPPSYSALEPFCSALPPSYSTLEVNQDAPEYFKT